MRLSAVCPAILVLSSSLVVAINLPVNSVDGAQSSRQRRDVYSESGSAQKASMSSRPYKGTEAAPIDGLDGMPHAGPFVESTPDRAKKGGASKATIKPVPTSLKNLKDTVDEAIPEKNDGVMDDDNRPVPNAGTRGTSGGVSEKDKERKAKGNSQTIPQSPAEAPPLPHSEQQKVDAHLESLGQESKEKKSSTTKQVDHEEGDKSGRKSDGKTIELKAGDIGMQKPTDLPDKPHNIPHPDPKKPTLLNPDAMGGKRPSSQYKSIKPASETSEDLPWHEWVHSFVLSLTMILFSEVGDKTFLIAALMAMRHTRLLVFSAAFSALIAMTVLSAVLGHAVPTLLPKRFTTFAAAILFLVFGVRMLREGLAMPKDFGVGEEMAEVEAELEEKEHEVKRHTRRRSSVSPYALESGRSRTNGDISRSHPSPTSSRETSPLGRQTTVAGLTNLLSLVLSPAWVQTFVMTFLGEWGDRSQIATIAMAAGQDYWWVTLGAVTGHACCTGVAVLGGRALAGRVSMRVVTIGGAVAFLVFGVIYLYECLGESTI